MDIRRQSKTHQTTGTKSRVVQAHPNFATHLTQLRASPSKQDRYLVKLIDDSINLLSQERTLGNSVPRDRWPKQYKDLMIPCLYKYNLDSNYRMTYSFIKTSKQTTFAWIIWVMTHKEYEELFGY